MSSKKWYEYFVSVEGDANAPANQPASLNPFGAQPGDAASAIAQIAAQVQQPVAAAPPPPPAKFEKTAAAGVSMTFEDIYAAAEIKPPAHGYTVFKVADMLQSEHIRELPAEVKKGSILVALDAAGVKIADVVQDAIRRDQALDAFERVRQKSVEDLEAKKLAENQKIQADLDKYVEEQKARLKANLAEIDKQKESFSSWRIQKQLEEQRIADCVSYFVTDNPITTAGGTTKAGS
ncbi:MAG TPA: hypothetical protein VFQ91_14505 [Bryobacteraceae bacterium]|nr:hypothetical protein [Bryobacteraceae bacterium]